MTNAGFAQLPPDIDYADPETDALCHYCGSVLLAWDGDCAVCEPRCLVEDSPVRFSATLHADRVRFQAVELFGFIDGNALALVTWEGGPFRERQCVGAVRL